MKTIKKALALLLALSMLLALAACAGSETKSGDTSNDTASTAPTQTETEKPAEDSGSETSDTTAGTQTDTPAVGEFTVDGTLSCDLTGLTFAFIYQDLETEFWVEAYNWTMNNMSAAGAEIVEYNAKQDVNKQLEYVQDACAQLVDAILMIPQDSDSAVSAAQVANEAGIPIAFINRVPSDMDACKAIACQADNEAIAQGAMEYVLQEAVAKYGKVNIIDMIGDLGDVNAIARENGFRNAMAKYEDQIGEIYTVTTNWDANTALANLQTVLQSTTDIQVLCCGSDFLYPQIESALEEVGLWHTRDEEGHVYMCAVDGDSGAAAYMDAGYVDATGVQDVYNECRLCIEALAKAVSDGNTTPSELLTDPGVAQTVESMKTNRHAMWGFQVLDAK